VYGIANSQDGPSTIYPLVKGSLIHDPKDNALYAVQDSGLQNFDRDIELAAWNGFPTITKFDESFATILGVFKSNGKYEANSVSKNNALSPYFMIYTVYSFTCLTLGLTNPFFGPADKY
jgi:hypothetical protein